MKDAQICINSPLRSTHKACPSRWGWPWVQSRKSPKVPIAWSLCSFRFAQKKTYVKSIKFYWGLGFPISSYFILFHLHLSLIHHWGRHSQFSPWRTWRQQRIPSPCWCKWPHLRERRFSKTMAKRKSRKISTASWHENLAFHPPKLHIRHKVYSDPPNWESAHHSNWRNIV